MSMDAESSRANVLPDLDTMHAVLAETRRVFGDAAAEMAGHQVAVVERARTLQAIAEAGAALEGIELPSVAEQSGDPNIPAGFSGWVIAMGGDLSGVMDGTGPAAMPVYSHQYLVLTPSGLFRIRTRPAVGYRGLGAEIRAALLGSDPARDNEDAPVWWSAGPDLLTRPGGDSRVSRSPLDHLDAQIEPRIRAAVEAFVGGSSNSGE